MVLTPLDGEATATVCPILRVEPPRLFEHTHLDGASYLRWQLEAVASGCVLRLSHFLLDPTRAIENSYVAGLHTSLARLEPCLAGRPVAWDWDAFADAQAHYAGVGLAPTIRTEERER